MFAAVASATTPPQDPPGGINAPMQSPNPELDNTLKNANGSGENTSGTNARPNDAILSDGMTNQDGTTGTQRTHGEYHNNTNSCASCHQTHTGASKSLLFKDGVYATCAACHDGTLGFYNVFENGNHKNSAGTFGGTTEGNMSVHLATGAVNIAAAPGGYTATDKGGKWTTEFNCASCHSPHGSYSDRLLHYSPNNMASTPAANGGIKAGGYKAGETVAVYPFSADGTYTAAGSAKFIAVKGTKTQHGITDANIGDDYAVVMIYQKSGTTATYTKTTNPFQYGYPTRGSGSNNHYYYTRLFTQDPTTPGFMNTNGTYPSAQADKVIDHYDYLAYDAETDPLKKAYIKYAKGYIYGPAGGVVDSAAFAEISRAYVVKLDLMPINAMADGSDDSDKDGWKDFGGVKITTVNQRTLYAGETSTYSTNVAKWGVTPGAKVSGWGIAMSGYCSACHVDYLASSSNQTKVNGGEGIFTKGFRHTTTSDSYTCVRCHFAHGTDVEIMRDAHNRTVADVATLPGMDATKATAYMLDKNPSSALKRYTNMAVCWSCHTSSRAEQLKNTSSYEYKADGSADPRGIPTIEGTANHPTPK